jgi:NAD+ synthase
MKILSDKIVEWLSQYLITSNKKSFIIGVSGGVDSGLVSTLCALTGKHTIVLSMPILQDNSQLKRAENHINWLKNKFDNIESKIIDLTEVFLKFESFFNQQDRLASANTRSRLRMITLYHVASLYKGLVVGTGNKVEDFGIGFYTKYGDGGVDISPIGDLLKSEVRTMAKELNLLDEISNATPTDGLWDDNRSDEDQIGATYDELEWAMSSEDKNKNTFSLRQEKVLEIYNNLRKQNLHKIEPIPVFRTHL